MKHARIKKLIKQEWMERMKWLKNTNHIQTIHKVINPEYD